MPGQRAAIDNERHAGTVEHRLTGTGNGLVESAIHIAKAVHCHAGTDRRRTWVWCDIQRVMRRVDAADVCQLGATRNQYCGCVEAAAHVGAEAKTELHLPTGNHRRGHADRRPTARATPSSRTGDARQRGTTATTAGHQWQAQEQQPKYARTLVQCGLPVEGYCHLNG